MTATSKFKRDIFEAIKLINPELLKRAAGTIYQPKAKELSGELPEASAGQLESPEIRTRGSGLSLPKI
jgi:hypothetical protein